MRTVRASCLAGFAIAAMSVTLGLELDINGLCGDFYSFVTSAALSGAGPKLIPPCTLGQLILTSMIPTCSTLSIFRRRMRSLLLKSPKYWL